MVQLALRFAVDLAVVGLVVRAAYLPRFERSEDGQDWAFTYLVLNVVTFAMTFLMSRVPMDIGFGLGLFALFGILRYRTEPLAVRDLTYLFVSIGVAVLHGLHSEMLTLGELVVLDVAVVMSTLVFERWLPGRSRSSVKLSYDRLDLIAPGKRQEMLADIRERYALRVSSVRLVRIDTLRDVADLDVELD